VDVSEKDFDPTSCLEELCKLESGNELQTTARLAQMRTACPEVDRCAYISAMRPASGRGSPVDLQWAPLLQHLLDYLGVEGLLKVCLDQSHLLLYRHFVTHGGGGAHSSLPSAIRVEWTKGR
jgi:hypothetical protein